MSLCQQPVPGGAGGRAVAEKTSLRKKHLRRNLKDGLSINQVKRQTEKYSRPKEWYVQRS